MTDADVLPRLINTNLKNISRVPENCSLVFTKSPSWFEFTLQFSPIDFFFGIKFEIWQWFVIQRSDSNFEKLDSYSTQVPVQLHESPLFENWACWTTQFRNWPNLKFTIFSPLPIGFVWEICSKAMRNWMLCAEPLSVAVLQYQRWLIFVEFFNQF